MANSWGQVFSELFGMAVSFFLISTIFALIYKYALGKKHFTTLQDQEEAKFFDYFYFACTTTSSVGYGDIYPLTPLAKLVVIINQFVAIGGVYLIPSYLAEITHQVIFYGEDEMDTSGRKKKRKINFIKKNYNK